MTVQQYNRHGMRMQRFFDNGYSWQLGNVCWKLVRCASFSKLFSLRSFVRSSARLPLPLPLLSLPEHVSAVLRFAFVATRQSWVASAAPINWTVWRTHFSFWTHSVQIYQRICADYRTHIIRKHALTQPVRQSRTDSRTHTGEHSERNRKSHQVPH